MVGPNPNPNPIQTRAGSNGIGKKQQAAKQAWGLLRRMSGSLSPQVLSVDGPSVDDAGGL